MFSTHMISRRRLLRLSLTSMTGVGLAAGIRGLYYLGQSSPSQLAPSQSASSFDLSNAESTRDFTVQEEDTLVNKAAARGLLYGAAANYPATSSDAEFSRLFAQECGILVPENELKWSAIRPSPDRFDFTRADWLAEFARSQGMLFRGHTLVWKQSLPRWFREVVNRQNAEQFLREHIETVTQHFKGQIHSWDVVNEAVSAERSRRPDGLEGSPWLEFLGKDYIDLAFRLAAESDPQSLRVYNDRWLDYDTSRDNAQRDAVFNLLSDLKSRGTPIDALGIQAHLGSTGTSFNPEKLRTFLREVANLGLKILITELDVRDNRAPAEVEERDRLVAAAYEDYLSVVLEEPAVIAVLTWGLSDRYTWLSKFAPREDGLPVRPLPFDKNLNPKLAWNAIARSFDQAPQR